jgi:hypothetical protein
MVTPRIGTKPKSTEASTRETYQNARKNLAVAMIHRDLLRAEVQLEQTTVRLRRPERSIDANIDLPRTGGDPHDQDIQSR